jgi:hypothetical protein
LNDAVSFLSRSASRRFAKRLGIRFFVTVNPRPRLRGARVDVRPASNFDLPIPSLSL